MPHTLLQPDRTALLLVDFQARLMPHIAGGEQLIANARKLIELARQLKLPLFLTTQYAKGLGDTVPEIVQAAGDVQPLDKSCFGCFGDADFREALAATAPVGSHLLIAGVESHICVLQTALGARSAGYGVHVVADATSSRTEANRDIGIARLRDAGCVISSTEMAIYELLGDSSRPEFKAMLPHLK